MFKKLLLGLMILCSLALPVSAAVILAPSTLVLSGNDGSTVSGPVTLNWTTNYTNANITKTNLVSAASTISNSTISFSPSEPYTLATGSNQTVTVSVAIPSNQYTGNYTGTLTLVGSSSDTSSITLQVNVNPRPAMTSSFSVMDFGTVSRNSTVAKTLTLTNTGNINLTNVNLSHSAASKYNLSMSETANFLLGAGASRNIIFNVTVPSDEVATNHSIGALSVNSGQLNLSSIDIRMRPRSKLFISDVDVTVDGDKESDLKDGETIDKEAKPGSEVKISVEVSNGFTDAEDIDIEDVEIKVTIEDIDDGDDLEEEADSFDLEADKEDDGTVEFEIPLDVEEDTYDILIEVEGEDEKGVKHEDTIKLKLDVDKEKHQIRIASFDLSPKNVKCGETASVSATIDNTGAEDEERAAIEIESSALGLNFEDLTMDIEEGDSESRTAYVTIGNDVSPGSYPISITAAYDVDKITDREVTTLTVDECKKATTTTTQQTPVVTQPAAPQAAPSVSQVPVSTESSGLSGFLNSTSGIAVMAVVGVALLGGIVTMVFKLAAMKK